MRPLPLALAGFLALAGCLAPEERPSGTAAGEASPPVLASRESSGRHAGEASFRIVGACAAGACAPYSEWTPGEFATRSTVRAEVILSWTAATSMTETLAASLLRDGERIAGKEGRSPLAFSFDALPSGAFEIWVWPTGTVAGVVDQKVAWEAVTTPVPS